MASRKLSRLIRQRPPLNQAAAPSSRLASLARQKLDGLPPATVERLARLEGMPPAVVAFALDALRPGSRDTLISLELAEERPGGDDAGQHLVLTELGKSAAAIAAALVRESAEPLDERSRSVMDAENDAFLKELSDRPGLLIPEPAMQGRRDEWGDETDAAAVGTQEAAVASVAGAPRDWAIPRPHATHRLPDLQEERASLLVLADQVNHNQRETREAFLGSCCFAELLKAAAPLALHDLVHRTAFSRHTVFQAVSALVRRDYVSAATVDEEEWDDGTLFRVDSDRHCVLGVSVQDGQIVGIVSALEGEILHRERHVLTGAKAKKSEAVIDAITGLVEHLLALSPRRPIGLGVELAGHVVARTGEVIYTPRLGWRHVPLGQMLKESTGLVTVVENDVNALAVHEQWFGEGRDCKDFGVVFIGGGVGAGLVLDGTLYHGRSGLAGEIGHIVVDRNGRGCGCGGSGHVESYASIHSIVEMVIERGAKIVEGFDLDAAAALAETESRYREPFKKAGEALGHGIATLLTINNLERLIITGPKCLVASDRMAGFVFKQAVLDTAGELAFDSGFRDCSLVWHATRADYGTLGAASTVLREFIHRPLAWEGRISARSEAMS